VVLTMLRVHCAGRLNGFLARRMLSGMLDITLTCICTVTNALRMLVWDSEAIEIQQCSYASHTSTKNCTKHYNMFALQTAGYTMDTALFEHLGHLGIQTLASLRAVGMNASYVLLEVHVAACSTSTYPLCMFMLGKGNTISMDGHITCWNNSGRMEHTGIVHMCDTLLLHAIQNRIHLTNSRAGNCGTMRHNACAVSKLQVTYMDWGALRSREAWPNVVLYASSYQAHNLYVLSHVLLLVRCFERVCSGHDYITTVLAIACMMSHGCLLCIATVNDQVTTMPVHSWVLGSYCSRFLPSCLERTLTTDAIVILGTQCLQLHHNDTAYSKDYGDVCDTMITPLHVCTSPCHNHMRAIDCRAGSHALLHELHCGPVTTHDVDACRPLESYGTVLDTCHRDASVTPSRNGGGQDYTRCVASTTECITDVGMYCEPQERRYCGVHALNALAGRRITTGQQMVSFFQETWPDGANAHGGVPYYEPCGNFCASAINRWMWTHTCQPVTLVKFLSNIIDTIRYSKRELLSFLPDDCGGIFIWFMHSDNTPHFKCIKQLPGTNTWYSLDSLEAGITGKAIPMILDAQWYELHGEFYFAASIDALEYKQIDGYVNRGMQKTLPVDTRTLQVAHLEFIDFSHQHVRQVPSHPRLQQRGHSSMRNTTADGTRAVCGPSRSHNGMLPNLTKDDPHAITNDESVNPQQRTNKPSIPQDMPIDIKPVDIGNIGEPVTRARPSLVHVRRKVPQRVPKPTPGRRQHAQQSILPFLTKLNTNIVGDTDTNSCELPVHVQQKCESHDDKFEDCKSIPTCDGGKENTQPVTTTITVLTWNVMGLTTIGDELLDIVTRHRPDVVVLTETKLTERSSGKPWIKALLPGYSIQYSSAPYANKVGGPHRPNHNIPMRDGSAGVIVAIANEHAHSGNMQTIPQSKSLRGFLGVSTITPKVKPGAMPISVTGVYMPSSCTTTRQHILQALSTSLQSSPECVHVLAGDWNMDLTPQVRTTTQSYCPLSAHYRPTRNPPLSRPW
jgi:exonuclease III